MSFGTLGVLGVVIEKARFEQRLEEVKQVTRKEIKRLFLAVETVQRS